MDTFSDRECKASNRYLNLVFVFVCLNLSSEFLGSSFLEKSECGGALDIYTLRLSLGKGCAWLLFSRRLNLLSSFPPF